MVAGFMVLWSALIFIVHCGTDLEGHILKNISVMIVIQSKPSKSVPHIVSIS